MNAIAPAITEPIGARYGFPWVFAMSGLAALLGYAFARKLPAHAGRLGTTPALAIPRQARPVLLSLAMCGAGFNVVMTFLAPLALSRGAAAVRGFFAAYTLAALSVRLLGSAWTDRIGPRRIAMLGTILYGVTIAAIAAVGPRSMVPLVLVFGLTHGVLFPALMAQLFHDTAPAERAKLAAFSNGVMNLGVLTVLGFGPMANHFGLVSVFLTTGTLVAASALVRGEVSSS